MQMAIPPNNGESKLPDPEQIIPGWKEAIHRGERNIEDYCAAGSFFVLSGFYLTFLPDIVKEAKRNNQLTPEYKAKLRRNLKAISANYDALGLVKPHEWPGEKLREILEEDDAAEGKQ